MNNRFTQLITLTVFAAGLAFAQSTAGSRGAGTFDPAAMLQRRIAMLTQRLGLSDAQQQQATKIYTDAQTAAQTPRASIAQNRTSLQDAVKKNDVGAIEQLSATIGTLEGQTTAIQSKADAAFYAILTPDQQASYSKAQAHMGMGGGPGRMGGRMNPNR